MKSVPTSDDTLKSFAGYYANTGASATKLTIPDSVTKIGGEAFYDCTSEIFYEGTMERWSQIELLTNDNYLTNAIPSGKVIHCTDGDITIT